MIINILSSSLCLVRLSKQIRELSASALQIESRNFCNNRSDVETFINNSWDEFWCLTCWWLKADYKYSNKRVIGNDGKSQTFRWSCHNFPERKFPSSTQTLIRGELDQVSSLSFWEIALNDSLQSLLCQARIFTPTNFTFDQNNFVLCLIGTHACSSSLQKTFHVKRR